MQLCITNKFETNSKLRHLVFFIHTLMRSFIPWSNLWWSHRWPRQIPIFLEMLLHILLEDIQKRPEMRALSDHPLSWFPFSTGRGNQLPHSSVSNYDRFPSSPASTKSVPSCARRSLCDNTTRKNKLAKFWWITAAPGELPICLKGGMFIKVPKGP